MSDSRSVKFFKSGAGTTIVAGRAGSRRLIAATLLAVVGGLSSGAGAGVGEGGCVTAEVLGVGLTNISTTPIVAIDVVGDFAYMVDIRRNLVVFDISDLSSPIVVGHFPVAPNDIASFNWNVQVVDGLAYLVNGGASFDPGGLKIFDVHDPASITLIGVFDTDDAMNIEVADSMAYIMNDTGLLQIVSVADPEDPILAGSYIAPGEVRDVEVIDGIAYMACDGSGLVLVDITDALDPVVLGSFAMTGTPSDIEVMNSIVYIANDTDGLVIVDVVDPTQPALIGSFGIESGANQIAISGEVVHVLSRGGSGVSPAVLSFGIADPYTPVFLGSYYEETPWTFDIKARGETVFLGVGAGLDAGLIIMDVTNSCSDGCRADLNGDGELNFFDISAFVSGLPDFNQDGVFNFFDVSDFVGAFGAGCP